MKTLFLFVFSLIILISCQNTPILDPDGDGAIIPEPKDTTGSSSDTLPEPIENSSLKLIVDSNTKMGSKNIARIKSFATFQNISNDTIEVRAKMEMIELSGDHQATFCWFEQGGQGLCYVPFSRDFTSNFTITLAPGEVLNESSFIAYLHPNNESGRSQIRYHFYNDKDKADRVIYDIEFIAE